ncbi:hypothetical protein RMN57_21400 [Kitasatospora sp. CM 4170]|uniref:Uncharacterized protein n=1 Tax=Kitasatospora aburaviensis TaxID=67265 RepID=A0ABW1EZJ2_9ACTN|nr:hypothetical protein [Kitasatospora sp. CM 4170]WNM47077.1 hypothetical protein RMN57_21400 [Kitasatospora sp. CM 4170]
MQPVRPNPATASTAAARTTPLRTATARGSARRTANARTTAGRPSRAPTSRTARTERIAATEPLFHSPTRPPMRTAHSW